MNGKAALLIIVSIAVAFACCSSDPEGPVTKQFLDSLTYGVRAGSTFVDTFDVTASVIPVPFGIGGSINFILLGFGGEILFGLVGLFQLFGSFGLFLFPDSIFTGKPLFLFLFSSFFFLPFFFNCFKFGKSFFDLVLSVD